MSTYQLGAALLLILLAHRASVIIYRLYLHPLAKFPGPKLAAASTLYRAYYQFWRDGELLHALICLRETYGPVIRISPNEIEFCTPDAYYEIYSSSFNGKKDPDYYDHLRGEQDTFFFMDDDPKEYKARFMPIAPLFSNRYYAQHEASIKRNVEQFSRLLSESAAKEKPCSLAAGFRSLSNGVMNDFIFSNVPEEFKTLRTIDFEDPLTIATGDVFNWTLWLTRNFPLLSSVITRLPPPIVSLPTSAFDGMDQTIQIMAKLVEHEKHAGSAPKKQDCVMQRLINDSKKKDSDGACPVPDGVLRSEAIGLLLAGASDPPNILAFGTYMVARDPILQQQLHEELICAWSNIDDPIPSYQHLRQLPVLTGIVKESLRLTYGVTVGPARLVRRGGASVSGHHVPTGAVVSSSSYFVHMDETVFSQPDRFDPGRWASNTQLNSIVAFSRGPRMCPAERFSNILMYAAFATVFRRFHVDAFETTLKDFEWKQYFSNVFTGRPLRVKLQKRD